MTDAPNTRQHEILEFLRQHSRRHTYPPTVREIGRAVGLSSSSTVQNHLNALENKGFIRRDPTKSRTVEIVGDEAAASLTAAGRPVAQLFQVPLVGRVAAGTPVLAAENIEDHIAVGPDIAGGDDAFALTVHGDSMIDAGIHDGDVLLVRPRKDAPNGTIVVARIENEQTGEHEVTVKRFYREDGRVRLQPENRTLEPAFYRDVQLEGVVTAVIRLLR
jgi:repressor LexA